MTPARSAHILLVHFGELALKGRNRGRFEQLLAENVRIALAGLPIEKLERLFGRIAVTFRDPQSAEVLNPRLKKIYGAANFELARRTSLDLELLKTAIGEAVQGLTPSSFAIAARRANKKFPLTSVEINRIIGAHVADKTSWKVDLERPELLIHVHVLDDRAFFSFEKLPGPGGLPMGMSGKVVCLISGGIDSPVAAHRLMRRGCRPVFVHFHSSPLTSDASRAKVRSLVEALMRHLRPARLYLIPFADLQRRIVAETPAPLRVILYRRFMLRAAAAVARNERALALVTGDSLGQVASQTLENLAAIDAAAGIPVLRPLIGMDKLEIIREAEALGTFPISIEPHDDCCAFFMPRHPATSSSRRELAAAESGFDLEACVEGLLSAAEIIQVDPEAKDAGPAA